MTSETTIARKPVAFIKTNASLLLDLIRGLAALIVLMEHWRNVMFIDFPQLPAHRALFMPFYLLCGAGHQAVVIFFVLSGYLISGSVFRMLDRGTWSWKLYATHRLLRLWIVLIPGLLLCALWDGIGLHAHLAPLLYGGNAGNHMIPDVAAAHTLPVFGENLIFLQTIRTSAFGSDGALWSLASEFWYYVLFPLGLFALRPRTALPTRILCVLGFAGVSWFVGMGILGMFPIWLFGTALALLPAPRVGQAIRVVSAVLYIPLFFLLGRKVPLPALAIDFILGVVTFGFLWVLLSATSLAKPSLGERLSRTLSRFSFTLYVVHTPLIVLLTALIIGDARWVPSPTHLLEGGGVFLVIVVYAYVVASLTEFRTDRVRSALEARFFATKP